jgi:methylmalonyl-CoA mutase cobalamin-binding subunit
LLVATERVHGLAMALRDAGYEVIYVGVQPVEALIAVAEQEDVAAVVLAEGAAELHAAGVKVIDAKGLTVSDVLARLQ